MKEGFTLIELMIGIAIMAVLALVSAPKFSTQVKRTKDSRVIGTLSALRSASNFYYSDNFEHSVRMRSLIDNITHNEILEESISYTSGSSITSYQQQAGTVELVGGTISIGTVGELNGETSVAEIYYNNTDGTLYIDGVTGSGMNFLDTKENLWNEY